jgi:gamma-glutamyltranspeptidase/glutathione hydrolase
VRAELTARGHEIELAEDWTAGVGGMQGIAIHPENGTFMGGADPRRDGYVAGW